jgi:3-carboxy-cis,cis-muconate cycloisomerase
VASGPSTGGLFDGVLARGPVAGAVGDHAFLQAMLDFERALAAAQAATGLIEPRAAEAIAAACRAEDYDPAAIGAQAPSIGNPAGPLVKTLTARVGEGPDIGFLRAIATRLGWQFH